MGCTQSKVIEEATDVYRPAPTSFALFDINTVEEPWVINKANDDNEEHEEKIGHVAVVPILDKLDKFDDNGPHSWSEVSKELDQLKPTLTNPPLPKPEPVQQVASKTSSPLLKSNKPAQETIKKNHSFHTLEELDTKLSPPKPKTELNPKPKLEPVKKTEPKRSESQLGLVVAQREDDSQGFKPVKDNLFILKDKLEREKEGKLAAIGFRRDPLSQYPENCPPGGADSVVLYTTTLRGVRRTFEDCNRARTIIELHKVAIDERDVSLHGGFLNELRELLGEGVAVPRLFVKGRYIGGVDEVVELNETSRLSKILNAVGKNREDLSIVCQGCGGARFVPCLECGGSCKVVVGKDKERCPKCNENGLIQCPMCY